MSDSILSKIILLNKQDQIQKYVKNHLPNDPQSLERIYQDLANLSFTINEMISGKKKIPNRNITPLDIKQAKPSIKNNQANLNRYSSLKSFSSKKGNDYFERNKQENITKRQEALVRSLKEKGLRGNSQQIPLGMEIAHKEDLKIIKPLQSNIKSELKPKEPSSVLKCIQRFNLNKEFYSNTIKEGQVDQQKFYDREMKQFLDLRASSLKKINSKDEFHNETKLINSRKFSQVESLLFNKARTSLGSETTRTSSTIDMSASSPERRSRQKKIQQFSNAKSAKTEILINVCTQAMEDMNDNKTKSLLYENKKYQELREKGQGISNLMNDIKERLQFDGMELSNNSVEVTQMAREYLNNKMLDKYTFKYLKAISSKHSNATVLTNRKDLLKNQLKFRKILIDR